MMQPRIVGGHVALDLVNTVAPRPAPPGATDWLDSPAALLEWAQRVDLITTDEAAAGSADWSATPASAGQAWHAAIDVREALYAVLTAAMGAPGPGAASELETLILRWSAAIARSALTLGSTTPAILSIGTPGALLIPDRLAHAAVDLVRTGDLTQLRACPVDEGGCGWLFLDRSRNRSRRWCAMEDCGAQAKSRRLTDRRRVARAGR